MDKKILISIILVLVCFCTVETEKAHLAHPPIKPLQRWGYIPFTVLKKLSQPRLQGYDFLSITGIHLTASGRLQVAKDFFSVLKAKQINHQTTYPLISQTSLVASLRLLSHPTAHRRAIEQLSQLCIQHHFAGIHLDIEGQPATYRPYLQKFLQELKIILNQNQKKLSLALFPQVDFPKDLADFHRFPDYSQLVDEVVLMAYDYYKNQPGPVTSLDWAEKNLKYLQKRLSNQKIWLGVPLYGYEYSRQNQRRITVISQKTGYRQQKIYRAKRHRSGCIQIVKKNSVVYFPDQQLIKNFHHLAGKYQLKGLAFWRIGFEK